MKSISVSAVASLMLSLLLCSQCNADASVKSSPEYINIKKMYSQYPGHFDYIMLGDSITKSGKWNDLLPGYSVGNRGISGDDTTGMLDRIIDIEKAKPKVVFIMAGTNDITRNVKPDTVAKNIILMATKMKEKGITVVIQSTILSGEEKKYKNPSIASINNILKEFSKKSGTSYLDLNIYLSKNGLLKSEYTIDGTHLTVEGYKVWSKIITSYLDGSIR
ncbi:GDSL-type esterase/lipase family protein [Klebsiella pneumoniae]|uniref:GDSL-type esterase/lipase family protein n=1 Tax=Klebsiella pneumoniae TaxID=573 RepID=UPI0007CA30CF|nr:GDSL-type esterase/lipase family protein [Klebsiella pneumoniae]SAS99110.1 GDSL-like Lipase/Acylhydrolase [Klebsiella pneumoniae]